MPKWNFPLELRISLLIIFLFIHVCLYVFIQPLIVACNKTDLVSLDDLEKKDPESRNLIAELQKEGIPVIETSTITQKGVMDVRNEVRFNLFEF